MSEFLTDYAPISVNALVDGMVVDFEVYYKSGKDYAMLFKNVIVTPLLLSRVHRFINKYSNIYVPKERKPAMLETLVPTIQPIVFKGYNEVRESQATLLKHTLESGCVDSKESRKLADSVQDTLSTVDTSLILQSVSILREADDYLQTHCINVSLLNGIIGRWAGFDEKEIDKLVQLGILHDIGKLTLDQSILNKPGRLTAEEFEHVKQHTTYGFDLLIKSGISESDLLVGTLQHHERLNGRGYPNGLTSEVITKFARITAVSDVYDAMVAKRVYKEANSPFKILKQFSDGRYSELDIEYVSIFLESMEHELKGKKVFLSDGSVGEVVYVNRADYEYPLVRVGDETFQTNENRTCISILDI